MRYLIVAVNVVPVKGLDAKLPKIYFREFAAALRRRVVCPCRSPLAFERAEILGLAIDANIRHPAGPEPVPTDTFVSRRPATLLSATELILLGGDDPEVGPPIIEPVVVDMINLTATRTPHYQAVHQRRLTVYKREGVPRPTTRALQKIPCVRPD